MKAVVNFPSDAAPRTPRKRRQRLGGFGFLARGEPGIWLTGGALALGLIMVTGLIGLIVVQGLTTFWPRDIVRIVRADGSVLMGIVTEAEEFPVDEDVLFGYADDEAALARAALGGASDGILTRRMLRTGNFDLTGEHFTWVDDFLITEESRPEWAVLIERRKDGVFIGTPKAFEQDGVIVAEGAAEAWAEFERRLPIVDERSRQAFEIEKVEIGAVNRRTEKARLDVRRSEIETGAESAATLTAKERYAAIEAEAAREHDRLTTRIDALRAENEKSALICETADGRSVSLPLSRIVRGVAANQSSWTEKVGVYFSRAWEFLSAEPREANAEGGVFPAIFGTVAMTLIMSLIVAPFGVLAALYLREYAKGGLAVTIVRIAINNLAGVPSIVFGVFGLGFFCYVIGSGIDEAAFPEYLPNPTFGTGGVMWASLTLALLTLPVVIVATEEALAAVPNSMREGSFACGASRWQTIRRIILPRAMPGIMTGMILAMARGAGEVAPLMLVGAVKLAPELPVDGIFPYLHAERSFMHLGFHIFDLGFQSQNSEAAKPMVYTTTLLLIGIVVTLNVGAIRLRGLLSRRFRGSQF